MKNDEFINVAPNVNLHVRDWGQGKTIVFIPGWPLSHEMFEYQFTQLPQHGYRCIGITQRGFGKSSQPWDNYNYDIFADDINKVIENLDLHDVTLAGHSMGGAVALHYTARQNSNKISKLALFGAAAPSFTKRAGFPHGLDPTDVDALINLCNSDRAKLNADFGKIFFRTEKAVSPKLGEWFHNIGMEASPRATAACLVALRDADLRNDLSKIKVPTVIFHSIQDKI
ncbi:MAG: alpha/beta hydrolase, partial [bacterium]